MIYTRAHDVLYMSQCMHIHYAYTLCIYIHIYMHIYIYHIYLRSLHRLSGWIRSETDRDGMASILEFRLMLCYMAAITGLSYIDSYTLYFLSARMINRMPVPRQVSSPRKNDVICRVFYVETGSCGFESVSMPSNLPNRWHNQSTGHCRYW